MEKHRKKRTCFKRAKKPIHSALQVNPLVANSKYVSSKRITLKTGIFRNGKASDVALRHDYQSPESRARARENLNAVVRLANKHQKRQKHVEQVGETSALDNSSELTCNKDNDINYPFPAVSKNVAVDEERLQLDAKFKEEFLCKFYQSFVDGLYDLTKTTNIPLTESCKISFSKPKKQHDVRCSYSQFASTGSPIVLDDPSEAAKIPSSNHSDLEQPFELRIVPEHEHFPKNPLKFFDCNNSQQKMEKRLHASKLTLPGYQKCLKADAFTSWYVTDEDLLIRNFAPPLGDDEGNKDSPMHHALSPLKRPSDESDSPSPPRFFPMRMH